MCLYVSPTRLPISPSPAVLLCAVFTVSSAQNRPLVTLHPGFVVRSIAFSHDGQMLATGGDSAKVLVWHVHSGKITRSFTSRSKGIMNVWFSKDDKALAADD